MISVSGISPYPGIEKSNCDTWSTQKENEILWHVHVLSRFQPAADYLRSTHAASANKHVGDGNHSISLLKSKENEFRLSVGSVKIEYARYMGSGDIYYFHSTTSKTNI